MHVRGFDIHLMEAMWIIVAVRGYIQLRRMDQGLWEVQGTSLGNHGLFLMSLRPWSTRLYGMMLLYYDKERGIYINDQ